MVDTTTPIHASGNEPVTDANFAAHPGAQRKPPGITQQVLADRNAIHVTQLRRYEAATNQPTLDVLRTLALNTDDLVFDAGERGPHDESLRLHLEAPDQLDPNEQAHVTALIEGALLRHQARKLAAS